MNSKDWLVSKGIVPSETICEALDLALGEQREIVAAWMIHRGYATGHGDTIEALLQELGEQIDEHRRTHICVPAIPVSERDQKIVEKLIRDNIKKGKILSNRGK